jgi:uncharacterized protein YndB with AHSA1/START domain
MHNHIEQTIDINASASKVWRVFTDPNLSRQMGGEYVTDWQQGSMIGWKNVDGDVVTQGTILKITPELFLQHNLLGPDGKTAVSVLTYKLFEKDGMTTLEAKEEFTVPLDDEDFTDVIMGWNMAINTIKDIAEQ